MRLKTTERLIMKNKTFVALATALMTLVICFVLFPSTAKANGDSEIEVDIKPEEIVSTTPYTVNGIERTLILLNTSSVYLKVGEEKPKLVSANLKEFGFDKNGVVWFLPSYDTAIEYYSDMFPGRSHIIPIGEYNFVDDVESLIFDTSSGQKFVTGYKTFDGQTHPILTLDEMKAQLGISDNPSQPTPSTPAPSNPTPNPVIPPASTSPSNVQTQSPVTPNTPVVTPDVPTVSAEPVVTPKVSNKVSIKKNGSTTSIYEGDTVVSKLELKKGTLIWKGTTKSGKYKNVKSAGYIKKSKNFAFITKKGVAYIVSSKTGKKTRIVKKGAKKLVLSGKYVTKIKTKSGSVNVSNK